MSPAKIPATSTDDCDILYENITSTNRCRTEGIVENCEEIGSSAMNCPYQLIQHHHCTCKLTGSEYPNYVAEELALFLKLQSGLMQYSTDTKMQGSSKETVDLATGILGDDNPANYSDPGKDSDLMDCEVLWTNCVKSSEPGTDRPAKKLNDTKNLEGHQQKTEPKNFGSSNNEMVESKYDLMPLSTRLNDTSKNKKNKIRSRDCEICQISFASVDGLKLHLLDHMSDTESNANIYNKSIIALQELDQGPRSVKLKKRHVCVKCQKEFLGRESLRYHMNISHADGRPWQCKLCAKNYTREYHLRRHESIIH